MLHFLGFLSASVATTPATIDQVGGLLTAKYIGLQILTGCNGSWWWWRFITLHKLMRGVCSDAPSIVKSKPKPTHAPMPTIKPPPPPATTTKNTKTRTRTQATATSTTGHESPYSPAPNFLYFPTSWSEQFMQKTHQHSISGLCESLFNNAWSDQAPDCKKGFTRKYRVSPSLFGFAQFAN